MKKSSSHANPRIGNLIRVTSYEVNETKRPNVIKLYKTLDSLKNNPFMGFDKVMVIHPEEASYVTIVTNISEFERAKSYLKPKVEAVQIIWDHNTWWMFNYDVQEILS